MLSMMAESDESGCDLELADLVIEYSESEYGDNTAVVQP